MMVERENAKSEQYIFQYNDNPFSEVITYKTLNKIYKRHPKATQKFRDTKFSSESVNDEKFRKFIKLHKLPAIEFIKL